jgi:hypothetical protein
LAPASAVGCIFDCAQAPNTGSRCRPSGQRAQHIGIAIIIAAEIYVAYEMFYVGCPAPMLLELAMLTVIPVVYLVLMYLTFVSQE